MRRFLACWAVVAGLVLALPAAAFVDLAHVAAAKQAADELLRRAEGSSTSGTMQRRSDPEIARLLDTVFDVSVLGDKAPPINNIGPLGELARNGNRVALAYILAGTGRTDTDGADHATMLRVDRNTVTFAPEIGQFTDFQMRTTEMMARSALAFVGSAQPQVLEQPNVKAGLAQMRGGFATAIGGVLKTFTIQDLPKDWKAQRMTVLDGIGDTASRFLDESGKTSVKNLADGVSATLDPDLRQRVAAFGQRVAAPAK